MHTENRAYASFAAVATDVDGSPLLLLSELSDHTKYIGADDRLSMLFDGTAGFDNPQEGPRATVMGRAAKAGDADRERIKRRYLARHPGAEMYAGFHDFAFYRVAIERIHWVGGFARAAWIERGTRIDPAIADKFAAAEPELLGRFARRADSIASKLKRRSKGWRLTAIDPDGCVIARDKLSLRFAFETPVADPSEVDRALRVER